MKRAPVVRVLKGILRPVCKLLRHRLRHQCKRRPLRLLSECHQPLRCLIPRHRAQPGAYGSHQARQIHCLARFGQCSVEHIREQCSQPRFDGPQRCDHGAHSGDLQSRWKAGELIDLPKTAKRRIARRQKCQPALLERAGLQNAAGRPKRGETDQFDFRRIR